MNKIMKKYSYDDFFEKKEDAVMEFFHYAKDQKYAAEELITAGSPEKYLHAAGYLYHNAFEIFFKGLHLYHFQSFEGTHNLLALARKLNITFLAKENPLLQLLNEFQHLKYPTEKKRKTNPVCSTEDINCYEGEIGEKDLEKAGILFSKLWDQIEKDKKIAKILSKIDSTKKGGCRLMRIETR